MDKFDLELARRFDGVPFAPGMHLDGGALVVAVDGERVLLVSMATGALMPLGWHRAAGLALDYTDPGTLGHIIAAFAVARRHAPLLPPEGTRERVAEAERERDAATAWAVAAMQRCAELEVELAHEKAEHEKTIRYGGAFLESLRAIRLMCEPILGPDYDGACQDEMVEAVIAKLRAQETDHG